MRSLALAALARYDLPGAQIRLIANHLNAIFRVDTLDGRCYALRISHPPWRTAADLELEILWLRALARETTIGAPEPQANRDGEWITVVAGPGVPEPRRCVLLSWLPGRNLATDLTAPPLARLGRLAAQLHAHAAGFSPPPGSSRRTMHTLFAREETDVLFQADATPFFTSESQAVFTQVRARVDSAFAQLYADPQGRRVIHNDLHQENVKIWRGRLRPLDFEDAIWGYPVQDIAMTFSDLLFDSTLDTEAYQRLRAAFQQGYTSHSPWPETYAGQLDTFIAGRQLWRANWVARFEPEYAQRFNNWLATLFEPFLATDTLLK